MRNPQHLWLPVFIMAMLLAACASPGLAAYRDSPRRADEGPASGLALGETTTPTPSPPPTPTPSTPGPGVADLLANPPAPGQSGELDAYFSGAEAPLLPSRGGPAPLPDRVSCPTVYDAALTDRPFQAILFLLNGSSSNALPDDALWLIATVLEAAKPGVRIVPQLPYHARLHGHLGDPAFSNCQHAERIFVLEEVVEVYQEKPSESMPALLRLPAGYAEWPRYRNADFGFSLPHPPDWRAETLKEPNTLLSVALRAPQWPEYPVVVRVRSDETWYDQYAPASAPPLLQGEGFGVFQQGWVFQEEAKGSGLDGYRVDRRPAPGEREVSLLFSAQGRTYELALRYPTGFEAPQPLLTAYSAIVEGFQLDTLPGPTPTPPVKQTLGDGPFLTQQQVEVRVRERAGGEIEVLDGQLVSEAEARRLPGPCATFMGHPDGVWLLAVRGNYEGATRTLRLFLDAATGEQLCGEEIHPEATPQPTMAPGVTLPRPSPASPPRSAAPQPTMPPGVTATPVPRGR